MTASLLAVFTYLLFLPLTTANQTLDRLRKELREAFRRWIPIRRHTKEELERLARNLMLRTSAGMVTRAAVGAVVGGILAAPFTFGTSLGITAAGVGLGAAGGGLNAVFGAGKSNLSAEEERRFRLAEVQGTINSDRRACEELQEQLDSLKRTFTSTTSAGATTGALVSNVADAFTRASRFADSSVLLRDITQLVKSSPNAEEIRSILNNLKCPDETEIQRLVRRV